MLQPEKLEPGLDLGAPTVVVVAYGRLVPEELLAERLWLNVHPSLLPRWRGAAPVERALMAGDVETGVTIHRTVKELDAGPIAAQAAFLIEEDDDAGEVYARAAALAADLLGEVLADPSPAFRPQPEDGVTYASKLEPDDRILDLAKPARELVDVVRAPCRLGDLTVTVTPGIPASWTVTFPERVAVGIVCAVALAEAINAIARMADSFCDGLMTDFPPITPRARQKK